MQVGAQSALLFVAWGCQDSTSPPPKSVGVIEIPLALAKKAIGGDTAVYVTGKDGQKYRKFLGGGLRMTEQCTDEPPTADDCPLMYSPQEHESHFATPTGTASGVEPIWDGTDMTGSTVFSCAPYVVNPTFKVYVPEHSTYVTIEGHGVWMFAMSRGTSAFGVPMAEYYAAAGEHWSSVPDLSYYAMGGSIRGVCYTVKVRVPGAAALYVGFTRWYDYTGSIYRRGSSPGGSGSGGRGWAYSVTGDQWRNGEGQGEDWNDVLDTWWQSGGCTEGWEIWVDGDQKCDADGNAV